MPVKTLLVALAALVWVIWTYFGAMFAGLSVMAFDAPDSDKLLLPWLMFGSALFCPVWSLGCMAFAANKLRQRQPMPAIRRMALSLLGIVPALLVFVVGLWLGK
jgi:hypothetical protein